MSRTETAKLAGRLSVPQLTFRITSKFQRSKVKVTRPLWVAVQVTICRGRGHIVAAASQAVLLVEVHGGPVNRLLRQSVLYELHVPHTAHRTTFGTPLTLLPTGDSPADSDLTSWAAMYP